VRTRIGLLLIVVGLVAGCGTQSAPSPVTVSPVVVRPAQVKQLDVGTAPATAADDCNREASLRPSPLPPPGAMPPSTTMSAIQERGRLIVGVDQNQYLFGYRNAFTGQLEGFDIDIARQIARAIFGDPDRIQFRAVSGSEREKVLEDGDVDVVLRTYSITCDRKDKVAFSTTYFYADQKILVSKDSGINSAADLGGKKACAVAGTTSAAKLLELPSKPTVFGAPQWTDCMVMLQQGQVDAIGTDGVVLAGLVAQDPNVHVIGPNLSVEPYGVGIKKENVDLVRFVNAVLQRMRDDGTWEALYNANLRSFGPSPGPPAARYRD
jgi:polar amino acid transport system substrate-binding protein